MPLKVFTHTEVSYLQKRFRENLEANLHLYWRARKFQLQESPKPSFQIPGLIANSTGMVLEEIADYRELDPLGGLEDAEKIVDKLSNDAAVIVEFLIRQQTGYSNREAVNLYVTDLFERQNRIPNLNINICTNVPMSVADPCAVISGWIAYRFYFACGFPKKAESEYVFSEKQTPQGN